MQAAAHFSPRGNNQCAQVLMGQLGPQHTLPQPSNTSSDTQLRDEQGENEEHRRKSVMSRNGVQTPRATDCGKKAAVSAEHV